jgi:protein-S-isoprenylcysteine O-methyltransferase Ste14
MPASKKPTLRRVIVYAGGALVLLLARPDPRLYAIGALLCVAGELLRIWACGHLRKNQAVITGGPYRHVKNPLYLGTCVILVGAILAASDPTRGSASRYLLIVFLPFALGVFFLYYLPHKFRVEAGRLRRRFGIDWDEYDRRVPDFLPSPIPRVPGNSTFDRRLVAENSEVSTAILVAAGLALLSLRLLHDLTLPW